MNPSFTFKQFALYQSQTAFKLGTDSILLGSWLPNTNCKKVLDIGAGNGILSLMMAQRYNETTILAVEIDAPSATDCLHNFSISPWFNRLQITTEDIIKWSEKNMGEKFDLIITNPPYFKNSLKNPDSRKSIARHIGNLNFSIWANIIKSHLTQKGSFCVILPLNEFNEMEDTLAVNKILLNNVCEISSFKKSAVIRKMGIFSFIQKNKITEKQYLYNKDKSKSEWYKNISTDFYL